MLQDALLGITKCLSNQQSGWTVMLSAAKHLAARRARPFAEFTLSTANGLRVTLVGNYNNPLLCKKEVATSLTASLTDVPLAFFIATCCCKLILTSVVRYGASGLRALAIPGSLCSRESRTIGAGWNSVNPCLSSLRKMKPCVRTDPSV